MLLVALEVIKAPRKEIGKNTDGVVFYIRMYFAAPIIHFMSNLVKYPSVQ